MLKNQAMDDKEYINDALSSQKNATSTYNAYANECQHEDLRVDFMNILKEEHDIEHEVFDLMQQRGWYPVPQAEQTKIDEAKQKFTNM